MITAKLDIITRHSRINPLPSPAAMLVAVLLTALSGCGDDNNAPQDTGSSDVGDGVDIATETDVAHDEAVPVGPCGQPFDAITASLGTWDIAVATDGAWSVTPAGGAQAVISAPAACTEVSENEVKTSLRVGRGEAHVRAQFGSFRITLEGQPSDISWLEAAGAAGPSEVTADTIDIPVRWEGDGEPIVGSLVFSLTDNGDLEISTSTTDEEASAGEIQLDCREGEGFFGLGTQAFGMNLRGGTFPLWTQEQGVDKPDNGGVFPLNNFPEAAYAPMGIWHSSEGYSAILGQDIFHELDLCEGDDAVLRLRTYPGLPSLVLVAGDTMRDRLTKITDEYVGRMTELPDWVFGPWNDSVGGPDHLRDLAATLRENDIPSTAIWSEDWIGGEQGVTGYHLTYAWEWDQAQYPDLPNDIDWLHERGFAFLGYFNPFVPSTTRMFEEGAEGGFLIHDADGGDYIFGDPFFRDSSLVDLTNEDAVAWLEGYLTTAADDLGIDGWMADFAEWMPHDAVLASGVDAWEYHNRYPLEWQRVNRRIMSSVHEAEESEEDNNWVYFARSGWASTNGGTAGIAPTMWGGDQNTDWGYDDGLPTVVPIAANAGLAGVAVFGTDIAGYTAATNPATTKELFYRWSTLGAFHALMRTHHGSDECRNWVFDRDEETLAHYTRYARVHSLLLPYFHNLQVDAISEGLPMIRHPALVEPEHPGLWQGDFSFFLGDNLWVAPVLDRGAVEREVRTPVAGWWPLFGDGPETDGAEGDGNTWQLSVPTPVTEIPVYVRPGTIIPLLWEPVDSFYGASLDDISNLEDVAGKYRLGLYPDGAGDLMTTTVGEATVTGSGWTVVPEWPEALVDGALVDACTGDQPTPPCSMSDGVLLSGSNITLAVSGAELVIESDAPRDYLVALGGDVWGDLGDPTPMTDLDPDIPPPCE